MSGVITVAGTLSADSTDSLNDDVVSAPSRIAASEVKLTPVFVHVLAGKSAGFLLTTTALSRQLKHDSAALNDLASVTVATAKMHIANPASFGALVLEVPVNIDASVDLDGVIFLVEVPPGTPDGTLITIDNVWVAGCAVELIELMSCVTIGFNHVPTGKGPVLEAVQAEVLSGLKVALYNGGSTEENDPDCVSGVKDIARDVTSFGIIRVDYMCVYCMACSEISDPYSHLS